jgi:hypothetical protein
METIGQRLEKARKAAGFPTPDDAVQSLGMKYPTYIAHENGTGGFRVQSAVIYARKFKVSLDWLLTGKGKGPGEVDEALDDLLASWAKLTHDEKANIQNTVRIFASRHSI